MCRRNTENIIFLPVVIYQVLFSTRLVPPWTVDVGAMSQLFHIWNVVWLQLMDSLFRLYRFLFYCDFYFKGFVSLLLLLLWNYHHRHHHRQHHSTLLELRHYANRAAGNPDRTPQKEISISVSPYPYHILTL